MTHRGLCVLHEQDFTDEIHLSLLNPVRGYGQLAQNLETELPPILNMPPWPTALTCQADNHKPSVLYLLNGVARITAGPTPAAIEIPQNDSDGIPLVPGDKE